MVENLLKSVNEKGETDLHLACGHGDDKKVKEILTKLAKVLTESKLNATLSGLITNVDQLTPFNYAILYCPVDAFKKIEEHFLAVGYNGRENDSYTLKRFLQKEYNSGNLGPIISTIGSKCSEKEIYDYFSAIFFIR